MTENKGTFDHPGIAAMTRYYVDHYLAHLGPFVSSIFFALISNSTTNGKRPAAYIKSVNLSIAQIADMAGISKRKSVDALKVLQDHWIIMRQAGRGRGNMNRYYFLPCQTWFHPDRSRGRGGMGP
ncbi:MAG: hypothetical protein H6Q52_534 [Deltaproteobacteria bacterium]|nr:hypothetical protein [Deltaproteobacteria bacterium]